LPVLLNAIVLDDTETGPEWKKQIQFSLDKDGRGALFYVNPAARALAAHQAFPRARARQSPVEASLP
jgi:hypothetical protein